MCECGVAGGRRLPNSTPVIQTLPEKIALGRQPDKTIFASDLRHRLRLSHHSIFELR